MDLASGDNFQAGQTAKAGSGYRVQSLHKGRVRQKYFDDWGKGAVADFGEAEGQ